MLKKIKRIIAVSLTSLAVAVPAFVPAIASAQTPTVQGSLCQGAELQNPTSSADCATSTSSGGTNVNSLVADIVNIFSWVVGVVAVIMIIVGGFRYITSGGNDANVGAAKNTIMYAVIGLVIVALAQFIVRFVLNTATQTTP